MNEICGAWGGCPLPAGHNMGRADVPENHARPVTLDPSKRYPGDPYLDVRIATRRRDVEVQLRVGKSHASYLAPRLMRTHYGYILYWLGIHFIARKGKFGE